MNRRQFSANIALGLLAASESVSARASGVADIPPPSSSLPTELFDAAASAVSSATNVQEALAAWKIAANKALSFQNMTALVAKGSGDVRRIFSTVPEAYPVGGWKHLSGSDWSRHVLDRGETLVATGDVALARYFPDHALLRSLGARTLVNVPVVVCSKTVGAFAFLSSAEVFPEQSINLTRTLAAIAAPLFLLEQ
ncbi:GAF domain-containing protein [Cupriavidus basilensis]